MKYSHRIEDLITEIGSNEGIDYDKAVEVVRDTIDDLYGANEPNKSPKTHPGHSESCVCLRCYGVPVDDDGVPIHLLLARIKEEIGAGT